MNRKVGPHAMTRVVERIEVRLPTREPEVVLRLSPVVRLILAPMKMAVVVTLVNRNHGVGRVDDPTPLPAGRATRASCHNTPRPTTNRGIGSKRPAGNTK